MSVKKAESNSDEITEAQVRAYLKAHPDFFARNSEIVAELTPPERSLGDGIVDFQQRLVKNLQKDSKELKSRFEVLVDFCRDNMSVQSQVHGATLRLIRARNLEQLLEAVMSGIIWIIVIGFVAGLIARLLSPGPNKPSGFILTTVLGIIGAFLATFIGQTVGWYRLDQGAGFIGATVGPYARRLDNQ